jgi:hypothetical protein
MISGCKPRTPRQYIQPDVMEDLLVDYHIARSMAMQHGNYQEQQFNRLLYMGGVLQKYGVTQEQFDSSMVFYYTHADRFEKMCRRVSSRLENQALALGATEGEIGKYAALGVEGDTANIWRERPTLVMMPMPPYNRVDFDLPADSTFRKGDTYLLQFMADYFYQNGAKEGCIYVAVTYPDTVVTKQTRFTYSGLTQMRIEPNVKKRPTRVKGYFYLGGAQEQTTTLRLLFVNNVQLIRFHNQHAEEPENVTADSLASVTVADRTDVASTGGRDSVGQSHETLSAGRRAPTNRMVERIDSIKKMH